LSPPREEWVKNWLTGDGKWSSIQLKTTDQDRIYYKLQNLVLIPFKLIIPLFNCYWNKFICSYKVESRFCYKSCENDTESLKLFCSSLPSWDVIYCMNSQVWISSARWVCPRPPLGPVRPLLFSTMDSWLNPELSTRLVWLLVCIICWTLYDILKNLFLFVSISEAKILTLA
jgi:hypothetical protein